MKMFVTIISVFFFVSLNLHLFAQSDTEKTGFEFNVGADLVSKYLWRGVELSATPNFQPTAAISYKGLTLGTWGSTDLNNTYKEFDVFLSYDLNGLSFTIYDYFVQLPNSSNSDDISYFNYKKDETAHALDFIVAYNNTDVLPIDFAFSVIFWGADKKADDQEKNNYSMYLEAGYNHNISGNDFRAFVAATPYDSQYGDGIGAIDGFAVVNIGVTGKRAIKITENYSLPISVSAIVNPQTEKATLVFGLTF